MYEKRVITRDVYKSVYEAPKDYINPGTIRLVKLGTRKVKTIFDTYHHKGFAFLVISEGEVTRAECAALESPIFSEPHKVLTKLLQISPQAFIDVYNELNKENIWFETAKKVLTKKKEQLAEKAKLSPTEKMLLKLN